jgi:hypothetical protein
MLVEIYDPNYQTVQPHFLLATYGTLGKYWFRDEKNEKKNFADFHPYELES